jgi:hypothetical protein
MHCPQCGQEQISGEVNFCKSCGFSLDGVKELLATGNWPALEKQSHKERRSPRRKGVRHGVILLFIAMVFMPLIDLIGEPRGKVLPLMLLMAGLMRILYAVIFQEGAPRKNEQDSSLPYVAPITTDQLGSATRGFALPRSQKSPVAAFNARRMDTAEVVPPSVTEHTTKLLDESQEPE